MSKSTKEDPTSLGNVLLELEIVTREQLDQALEDQQTLRGDDLLGRLLIANGACTEEEITMAMSAQASLRSKKGKRECAMAVADLALERRRRKSVIIRRENLIKKGEQVRRSLTRTDTPGAIPAMLAKPSDT